MTEAAADPPFAYDTQYRPGEKDIHGLDIVGIYGARADFAVYSTEQTGIRWQHDNLNDGLRDVIHEFHRLLSTWSVIASSKVDRRRFDSLLGASMVAAFKSDAKEPAKSYFAIADRYIETRIREKVRFNFSLASLGVAIILSSLLGGLFFYLKSCCESALWEELCLAGLGGVIGAAISVLRRSSDLSLETFVSAKSLRLQGAFRVLLGLLFGIVAFTANKSNIAFGLVENVYAVFLLTLAAGFSEQLVPDLIERVIPKEEQALRESNENRNVVPSREEGLHEDGA